LASKQLLPILFDNENLVAVSKPAGLATIPGRGETTSVLEELSRQAGLPCSGTTDPRLRVVHRLDKGTTGVLLFAKNIEAQRHLSHQFQNNTVEKEYLALVAGRAIEDSGDIDSPIAPHPTIKARMTVSKHGRPARTLWKVEQRFRDFTLLRCLPKTGKTHQIRVHLLSIGLPLAIDPIYNRHAAPILLSQFKRDYRGKLGEPERPLIDRLTLHAECLRVRSLSDELLEIRAALPKDFATTLKMLVKYGGR
jgi:RluA family pseudouridine synthase